MNNKCFNNFYFWQNSGYFFSYEYFVLQKVNIRKA